MVPSIVVVESEINYRVLPTLPIPKISFILHDNCIANNLIK